MRTKATYWICAIVLELGLAAGAQETAPALALSRVAQAPVIDGDLAEAGWKDVAPVFLKKWPGGADPDLKTAVRLATDGVWLFIAYDCEDPTPQVPEKRSYVRDALSSQDKVECFIEPKRGSKIYLHLLMSPAGEQKDQLCTLTSGEPTRDAYFNPHWRCAGRKTDKGWAVEAAFPLFYLQEMAGPEAAEWGINFTREEHVKDGRFFYSWSMPPRGFHDPDHFGLLQKVPAERVKLPFAPVLINVEAGAGQWFGNPGQFAGGASNVFWLEAPDVKREKGVFVYPVKVGMGNDGGTGGKVRAQLDTGGGRPPVEWEVQFGPGERIEKEVTLGVWAERGEPVASLSLQDALGPWTVAMANFGGRPMETVSKIDAYPDRSFYTVEPEARIYCIANYPAEQLKSYTLAFVVQTPEGKELWTKNGVPVAEGEAVQGVPLAGIPNGRHVLRVALQDVAGKTVDQMTESFVKLPPLEKGNEVKADRYNRCVLVNGEPFFPFGITAMGVTPHVAKHRDEGFNTLFRWGAYYRCVDNKTTPAEAGQSDPLLEEAQKFGMKVVDGAWLLVGPAEAAYASPNFVTVMEGKWKDRLFAILPIVKQHPAYLATCWGDEPSDWTVQPGSRRLRDIARQGIDWIHALDGHHPACYNFAGLVPVNRQWTDNNDIYSAYSGSCGQELARYVRLANAVAERHHKPLWYMPKTEIFYSGYPTVPREDVAKAYIIMVHGGAGMYYFIQNPGLIHRDTRAGFKQHAPEIYALAPAIMRRPPKQTLTYAGISEEKIRNHEYAVALTLRTFADGTPVIILVNKENYAVDFTCALPWLPDEAQVVPMFGAQKGIGLKNHAFSETLAGLATRAYRLEGCRITNAATDHAIRITEQHPREAAGAGPRELLANPGFEQEGWWTVIKGQEPVPYQTGMAGEGEAHSGKHCLKLARQTNDPIQYVTSPVIRLEPNRRYQFSIWWRQETPDWPKQPDGSTLHYSGLDAHVQLVDPQQKESLPPDSRLPGLAAAMKHRNWQAHNISSAFTTGGQPVEVRVSIRYLGAGTVWVDDVSLRDLGPVPVLNRTRNLVKNSSFEVARLRGWPDYAVPRPSIYHTLDYLGYDDSPWRQDATQAYQGKHSLLVRESAIAWTDLMPRYSMAVKEGQAYTFSAYMRADREGVREKVIVDGVGEQEFTVGTEWRRYSFSGVRKRPSSQQVLLDCVAQIRLLSLGSSAKNQEATLWIDAVQFEEGQEPTPYVDDGYAPEYPVWKD